MAEPKVRLTQPSHIQTPCRSPLSNPARLRTSTEAIFHCYCQLSTGLLPAPRSLNNTPGQAGDSQSGCFICFCLFFHSLNKNKTKQRKYHLIILSWDHCYLGKFFHGYHLQTFIGHLKYIRHPTYLWREQRLANFFCKGPKSKYLRLCEPQTMFKSKPTV